MNFFLVTLFAFFLAAVQASPLGFTPRNNLDVFVPHILSPNSTTTWCIGQTETVEWNTDDAPDMISNGAAIVLIYPDNSHPQIQLAKGFNLRSGTQTVNVPSNITAGIYQIILFGDSGNRSEQFSIKACLAYDSPKA